LLGAVFGAARGALIVLAAALLAGLTSLPRHSVWRDSASGPLLADAVRLLKPLLPQSLAERMRYD
jgi:membrane protein required for colicin V production